MEGNQDNTIKKKNMTIKIVSGGGSGLAGIILLGGALATAALVSVFAFKRKHQFKANSTNKGEDHDLVGEEEGLSFLVPDSSSPQLNHHNSSSGTAATRNELGSQQIMILDGTSQIKGEDDEKIHISDTPERTKDSPLCDESSITTAEMLPEAEKVVNKNDSLEDVEVLKVDEETTYVSNQVDVVENDREVPPSSRHVSKVCNGNRDIIDGLEELVETAQPDRTGQECDGIGKIIIERRKILVDAVQSDQLSGGDNFNKLVYEYVGNGMIVAENKEEEPEEEVLVDQIKVDDNPHKGWEERVDDAGRTVDKCDELVGEIVAANGIQLSAELQAKTYRNQEIICSDLNEEFLFPVIDSSASPGLGTNGLVEDDERVIKGADAIEAAVHDDIKLEDRAQPQMIEAVEDDKDSHSIYREINSEKCEEGVRIAVKHDQQMQPCAEGGQIAVTDEQQMQPCKENSMIFINGDQEKYPSDNLSPETNSFQSNGFKMQESTFLQPGVPSLNNEYDSAETALHVDALKPMKNDGTSDETSADQIINKQLVHSSEKDKMEQCDDGNDNVVEKREEVETGRAVVLDTKSVEAEDYTNDTNNDEEAIKTVQTDNYEAENNLHLPVVEDNEYDDTVSRENTSDLGDLQIQLSEKEAEGEDTDIDCDEEGSVYEVEESSETTGDSSLDSTADAIWPAESVSVQEFSQKLKEMQANNQNFKEVDLHVKFNSNKLKGGNNDRREMAFPKAVTAETATQQSTNSLNLKIWLFSLLLPILLLLWLASSPPIVVMSE